MLATLVWLLLFLGFYPYVVYPLFLWLYGRLRNHPINRDDSFRPRVTIVTAAFNEAAHIAAAVNNKLAEDYPPGQMEVLVVSDGSLDGTDEIVAGTSVSRNCRETESDAEAGNTNACATGYVEA